MVISTFNNLVVSIRSKKARDKYRVVIKFYQVRRGRRELLVGYSSTVNSASKEQVEVKTARMVLSHFLNHGFDGTSITRFWSKMYEIHSR